MSTKNPQGDQDYSIPKRKPPRTPGGLGATPKKLIITSKIDGADEVTYFINLESNSHPIGTSLAYAFVRNGYAHFLTTEQAHDELFGG